MMLLETGEFLSIFGEIDLGWSLSDYGTDPLLRNTEKGGLNATFHFGSGTPHLCGPAGPETLKRSRKIRIGSGSA
jgi:hypothetical protein